MRELERLNADNEPTVLRTVAELRSAVAVARANGDSVGLVPTMGAFHDGHLSLMRCARSECALVVVSLFVNPTQFGEGEDLAAYPRDETRDLELAATAGVDIVFAPPPGEVYPDGFSTTVEVHGLTDVLCGAPSSRGAAHFKGVTTVVAKLLNMCRPDVAYFGRKDFQQALVIERMARDLDFDVAIETCPIVRESDGLAMSSRNGYLDRQEREQATAIKRALDAAAEAVPDPAAMKDAAAAELAAAGIEPEYIEILNADDLSPVEVAKDRSVVVAIAAPVGRARLIDNVVVEQAASNERAAQAA